MEETWSILQTTSAVADVAAATPILSRCCGIPAPEAANRIRSSRGILLRLQPSSHANAAAEELTRIGIPAVAAPDSITTAPIRPYMLRSATARADALVVHKEFGGQESVLPWQDVQVVAAGQVMQAETRRVTTSTGRRWAVVSTAMGLMSGIPVPVRFGGGITSKLEEQVEKRNFLTILGGNPLQHYRIDGGRFNYSGILPQPAPVAEANFCYVASGVRKSTSGAASNILPAHIGPDGSLALEVFPTPYDYDHLVTWLLALYRLGLWSPEVFQTEEPTSAIPTGAMPAGTMVVDAAPPDAVSADVIPRPETPPREAEAEDPSRSQD